MGGAIAVLLATHGADVALNDRRVDTTEPFAEEIRALGRDTFSVTTNVTREAGARELIDGALSRWGHVDILVNVVGGIKGPVSTPLWEITEDDWEYTLGINLRATFQCTKAVAPSMIEQRYGKIVNIASVAWAGEAAHPHYAVAKAGVVAFTRSAATQLAPYNVNVNAIAPGGTRRDAAIAAQLGLDDPAPMPIPMSVSSTGPLGRTNEPDDIANAALFLVTEASRNITGDLVTVAGGNNHRL